MATVGFSLLLLFILLLAGSILIPVFFGSVWYPTSKRSIQRILEFAETQPGQKIYDLGSGDGRVLITAARHFGLDGVGLEIDPFKVWLSRRFVLWAGLQDRIQILRGNIYDFDYREADIIFIYLTHQAIDRLFPTIVSQLKPTVKIVSHRFCLRGMKPSKVNNDRTIFIYELNKGSRLESYS